jgi:hypothetical protein
MLSSWQYLVEEAACRGLVIYNQPHLIRCASSPTPRRGAAAGIGEQEANEEESVKDYFGIYKQVTCAREASMKQHGQWLGINHTTSKLSKPSACMHTLCLLHGLYMRASQLMRA